MNRSRLNGVLLDGAPTLLAYLAAVVRSMLLPASPRSMDLPEALDSAIPAVDRQMFLPADPRFMEIAE